MNTPPIVYGIPNCDSVKKARVWMEEHAPSYVFHDFKKQGVPAEALDHWLAAVGWEVLVNRKGTTWRQLDEAERAAVVDAASAQALMLARVTVIRRPVIEAGPQLLVGFDPLAYAAAFQR